MKATKHISIGLALLISIMFAGCGKTSNTEANDAAKLEQEQANQKAKLEQEQANQKAKLEREKAKNLNNQKSKKIFDKITEKYNYSRFIDTWGNGRVLFLPEEAWYKLLSDKGRQILIEYCKNNNLKAIHVGAIKSYNVIYLDQTVWGK